MAKSLLHQLTKLYRVAYFQRAVRQLVRFIWTGLFGYAFVWILHYLFPDRSLLEFRWVGFLGFGVWALFGIFLPRFSLQQFVWRVDCIQGLKAQLATAYQYHSEESNAVIVSLNQQVSAKLPEIKSRILRRGWALMPEIEYLILALCLLSVLSIFSIPNLTIAKDYGVDIPPIRAERRREEIFQNGIFGVENYREVASSALGDAKTGEQLTDEQGQNQPLSATNEDMMQAIQALGEELKQSPLTQGLGEALEKGELEKSAQMLESVADQISTLPSPIQKEIGKVLSQAAEKFDQSSASELSNQLQSTADSLQKGDSSSGSQGLRQLGAELRKIAQQGKEANAPQGQSLQGGGGAGVGSSPGNVELGSPLLLDRLQGEKETLTLGGTGTAGSPIFVPGLAEVAGDSQTYSGQVDFFSLPATQVVQGQITPLPIIWTWLNEIKLYFLPR